MLPEGSVNADRVWKRFRGDRHRSLLRDEVQRLRSRRHGGDQSGWRWAVQDVSLQVAPGQSTALIGSNGSGKSTMLKMLVGVMYPYAGRIATSGRIGALIEVRAGIHPDLTARENVYMYGNLLGIPRKAVGARFDEIISFAGLEDAVDRQVKFFSSGMSMRLGFAVASFLDPAVLIVDEVLAVGDAEFQQKCLDRMRDVLASGTTLVYVSHDLATVEAMCTEAVWLDQGEIRAAGPVRETLHAYRQSVEQVQDDHLRTDEPVHVLSAAMSSPDAGAPQAGGPLDVTLELSSDRSQLARLVIGVSEGTSTPIFVVQGEVQLTQGASRHHCRLSQLPVPAGEYSLWLGITDATGRYMVPWRSLRHFTVGGAELLQAPTGVVRLSPVYVPAVWDA